MVGRFLVRYDGSMINLDCVEWVELRRRGSLYNTLVHLKSGKEAQWNEEPQYGPEARALLKDLQGSIRKAIE